MAQGNWTSGIIDLTGDSDDDDGLLILPPVKKERTRTGVSSPSGNSLLSRNAPSGRQPELVASTPRIPPLPAAASEADNRAPKATPASSFSPSQAPPQSSSSNRKGTGSHDTFSKNYVSGSSAHNSIKDGGSVSERAAKRIKLSTPENHTRSTPSEGIAKTHRSALASKVVGGQQTGVDRSSITTSASQPYPNPSSIRTLVTGTKPNLTKKLLEFERTNNGPNSSDLVVSNHGPGSESEPRALQVGRSLQGNKVASSSILPDLSITTSHMDMQRRGISQTRNDQAVLASDAEYTSSGPESRSRIVNGTPALVQPQPHHDRVSSEIQSPFEGDMVSRPVYPTGPAKSLQDNDKDSVMSDVSATATPDPQPTTEWNPVSVRPIQQSNLQHPSLRPIPLPGSLSVQAPSMVQNPTWVPTKMAIQGVELSQPKPKPKRAAISQFTAAEDHYLIFLKEVKALSWKQIVQEYNTDFPKREYSGLQSRYSTNLNKRDRSLDPPALQLPLRFAEEAVIDWALVHDNNPGPRARCELTGLDQPSDLNNQGRVAAKPLFLGQIIEQDYSSGGDSTSLRARSHRAKRVNYTWPRQRQPVSQPTIEGLDGDDAVLEDVMGSSISTRSETPVESTIVIPDTAIAVDNEPMPVDFVAEDAQIALSAGKRSTHLNQSQPYLSHQQRCALQKVHAEWDWDQLSSRQWQGSLLHVDFSPVEIGIVRNGIAKMQRLPRASRHSTQRRQLRDLLKDTAEPKILQLISSLRGDLPSRDASSIVAFLDDAKAGKIANAPQIKRFAAARPRTSTSTTQKFSTTAMLRQRELGHHSRRGWHAAPRPLTYQHRNKVMDTIGPIFSWTGASSDIHVVAWSPDGECFAAGAVAVEDSHSMQYNRPNNLLYGDTSNGTIHELGEHTRKREKTESGANSSHAMFVSQDPKLYTTVSSIAFSPSGRVMYSTGYDGSICVWRTDTRGYQPAIGSKLNVKAKIDMMAVNRHRVGVVATAANTTRSKAVRLLTVDEDDPTRFTKHSFHSSKAVARTDLNILPTALQFEPRFGGLLLAGFGANVRDNVFDTTGDLCLWDIETLTQLSIHGSGKNVFDIEFNPNRMYGPLFAVGCVAGSTGNRGTRSLLRIFDEQGGDKYRCPIEIDCTAYDMNDVVWNPHNENLIAAGCTDGRSYIWDLRWPVEAIRVLSHGRSLMPLPDDQPPEVTDTGVRFLSWGENGTRLYSGSSDGVIKVWDVTRSEEDTFIKDLITLDSGIMSGAFSSDMSKLVVGEVNGSVTVLEVGRDDFAMKDAEKLQYVPYDNNEDTKHFTTGGAIDLNADSGVTEGNQLVHSQQIQFVPLGGLPIRQAVQGPHYAGPYDQSVEAPFLRQQALEFQLSMTAQQGPRCDITGCKDTSKVTFEDIGDSGRSADRIPDELRLQWKAIDSKSGVVPGKAKCESCGRPARLPSNPEAEVECERCSFACFRCGTPNYIDPFTTTLRCTYCAGTWTVGALGYECIEQPVLATPQTKYMAKNLGHKLDFPLGFDVGALDVPLLERFGHEAYLERLEDAETSFGDEMSALTDYYFSLALDRPESPPL